MNSPLRRAPRRTSHLAAVPDDFEKNPHDAEGFLLSSRAYKAGAAIDFTSRIFSHVDSKRNFLIVPGFMGIKPVYGDFRDAVAWATRSKTTSYRTPRTQKAKSVAHYVDSKVHPAKLSKQAVVGMIDELREQDPDKKVTMITHSKGFPDAVDAALRRKDDIETIVAVGGGGLEKGQNIGRLALRMPGILMGEGGSIADMPREDALNIVFQALFHAARSPWRTAGEALEVGGRDLMVDEIVSLRASGIDIHAVQLDGDGFFPTDIAARDTKGLVNSLTVIPDIDHVGPQTHPELVAQHIHELLEAEENQFLAQTLMSGDTLTA